LTIENS